VKEKVMRSVEFGVIADTHVYDKETRLPSVLVDALEGVDFIIHAGDISTPAVLKELEKIAPVKAVVGNKADDVRFFKGTLPETLSFDIEGVRFIVTHGARSLDYRLESFLGKDPLGGNLLQQSAYMVKKALKQVGLKRASNLRIAKRLYKEFTNKADCIIFGHSHTPFADYIGSIFFLNPGDAQYTRKEIIHVVILRVKEQKIEHELIDLNVVKNEKR
jgi:predicted phosphodiesterase